MSFSQFNEKVTRADPADVEKFLGIAGLAPGKIALKIGGPLTLKPDADSYVAPAVIRFLIVHSKKGDHNPANASRARGVVEVKELTDRWEAVVEVDEEGFSAEGETRGIGVAVLEQKEGFSFETITWCDHIELDLGVSASGG